ncbi:MAG TPA: tetratricopeptide repeat protein [Polyangiales bacterium]
MDVTCDRCGTDYEFEEALVSTRGTTVKCTQCGHLFKVYRPEAPVESTSEKHQWTVRRTDGSIHRLASLADLTRLIGEAAFAREDEVSRTGKAWKKLGEIDELRSFFPNSERPPARQRRSTVPELGLRTTGNPPANAPLPRGVSSVPPPAAAPAAPTATSAAAPEAPVGRARIDTPRPTPRFESLGGAVDIDGRAESRSSDHVSARPAPAATPSPQPPSDLDAATTSRLRAVQGPAPLPVAQAIERTAAARPAPAPQRSTAAAWAAFIVVLTAAGLGIFLLWPQLQQRMRPATIADPTAEFVARADAAFATHRIQHFQDAITEYVKALAFHENDPHILSSVSRVYAVWTQELLFKIKALQADARGAKDAERHSEAVALDKEQRQLSEQAKRYGENAARKNPGNEEAEVALADALRLTGNLVAARSELDRARATETVASAETLRVAALLAVDEAGGDLRAGVKLASQAVAQEPDSIRARLLLARMLVADGDVAGARYHLNAVTMRDRSHPGITAIERELDRPTPPAADAGPDAATAESTKRPPSAAAESEEPRSYEAYISRGKVMLEAGEVSTAQRLFEQALFVRPTSAAAHTGLGYVALEKARPALAVEHFQQATRSGNAEAFIGLADAYRRLNRLRDALKAYQSYLSLEPAGAQASIAHAQVDRLTEELASGRSAR